MSAVPSSSPADTAPSSAPSSPAPAAGGIDPAAIPEGWELTTQTIRRRTAAPASSAPSIKPTAPVVGASIGSCVGPLIGYVAQALGHPIPSDALIAVTTLCAFLGGWLHPDGRS
jgi:hypothetical protein